MNLFKWLSKAEKIEDVEPPEATGLKGEVIEVLRMVYDPEIPVNIYDLGLIYRLDVDEATGKVEIDMTLTAPSCPVAESLPQQVRELVEHLEGVTDVKLELVWDPPWSQDHMSEAAKLDLGML